MSEFIPGTWAGLLPTHRTLPDTVIEARKAVEAAWKKHDELVDAFYFSYATTYGDVQVTREQMDAALQDALHMEEAARIAWLDWGIPGSHEAELERSVNYPMDIQ